MLYLRGRLPRAALGEPDRVLTVSGPLSAATAALEGFATWAPGKASCLERAPVPLAQGKRVPEALVRRRAYRLVDANALLWFKYLLLGVVKIL